jgi:ABC-type proline/glycine betaine transport system permease subunit
LQLSDYVLFAFLQNIAVTEKYGLGIVTINFLMFLVVAALWFWEVHCQEERLYSTKTAIVEILGVPFAFLAFWYPVNMNTLRPDFNPLYLSQIWLV